MKSLVPSVLLVLLLALVPSLVIGTSAPQYKIGVIHAGDDLAISDYVPLLLAAGNFINVTAIAADTPKVNVSLEWMEQFDGLLVWSDNPFYNSGGVGDNLADYIENGGAVVTALFTSVSTFSIGGRFASDYQVIIPVGSNDYLEQPVVEGPVYFPKHPIFANADLDDITGTYSLASAATVVDGAYVVARWNNSGILTAVYDAVGPAKKNRVDLGVWPLDPGTGGGPGASAQVVDLAVSALYYAINGTNSLQTYYNVCDTVPDFADLLINGGFLDESAVVFQNVTAGTVLSYGIHYIPVSITVGGFPSVVDFVVNATCSSGSNASMRLSTAWYWILEDTVKYLYSFFCV